MFNLQRRQCFYIIRHDIIRPVSGEEETLPTPEECAKSFLDSLPECERQMCMLAEQNEDEEVYKLIRRTIRKFSTEVDRILVSVKLYQWYKFLIAMKRLYDVR